MTKQETKVKVVDFAANADTIWRVPAYLPYLQPPLTDEAIATAQTQIGYKLPSEYLSLLSEQNGGYIRFSLPELVHSVIAGIGPHFPNLTEFDWSESQECVSFPLLGLVPFDGDGHWHLCLDYRKNARVPAITFADIECDQETHVANSFADYLAMLQIDVEEEYVLEGVMSIDSLKADLAQQLGVPFDAPDIWSHGYPTERVRLGSDENPQWLWLSPNSVPRGFVRSDDSRYSVLKDLMPGYGERFPGLPAGSYILSATDGVRARVLDACSQSRLITRPLREYLVGL
jgi:SMI1-KNR4 cell-wall